MSELTAKQRAFVFEYLKDFNATAAYQRAGYASTGKAAESASSRLLSNVKVGEAIREAQQKLAIKAEVKREEVLAELMILGFSDIGQIMDFSGTEPKLRPANEISAAGRRMIKSVKVKRYFEGAGENAREVEVTEFSLWDKKGALELLGKHIGLFPNKVDHSGTVEVQTVGIQVVLADPVVKQSHIPPAIQSRISGAYNGNGNGHSNGHANGYANGNGASNGASNGHGNDNGSIALGNSPGE